MNAFVITFSVVLLFCLKVSSDKSFRIHKVSQVAAGPVSIESVNHQTVSEINSTNFMSVNHYYCTTTETTDSKVILYGTKAWEFPVQDVNLNLTYPTDYIDPQPNQNYFISGFKVILYIDGTNSTGYIVEGGIMQDSIKLSFLVRRITSLTYQFWLYGTPKDKLLMPFLQIYSEFICEYIGGLL